MLWRFLKWLWCAVAGDAFYRGHGDAMRRGRGDSRGQLKIDFWYDAYYESGAWMEYSGGRLVVAYDRSLNVDLTQVTAANRPYQGTINGVTVPKFDTAINNHEIKVGEVITDQLKAEDKGEIWLACNVRTPTAAHGSSDIRMPAVDNTGAKPSSPDEYFWISFESFPDDTLYAVLRFRSATLGVFNVVITDAIPGGCNTTHIVRWWSDGDTWRCEVDGVERTVTPTLGVNGGQWYGELTGVDRLWLYTDDDEPNIDVGEVKSIYGGTLSPAGAAAQLADMQNKWT